VIYTKPDLSGFFMFNKNWTIYLIFLVVRGGTYHDKMTCEKKYSGITNGEILESEVVYVGGKYKTETTIRFGKMKWLSKN
jgi:hypothetical protein